MNGEGEITVGYYSESRMVKWIEDIIITLTMNDNHHPKHSIFACSVPISKLYLMLGF